MEAEYKKILREIKGDEVRKWKPQKESLAIVVIEEFLDSDMEMAEVKLDALSEPSPKEGARIRSTKQDSFASSFYAWKRKKSTKDRLSQLAIDILLIRRGEKVALKKVRKK